MAKKNYTIYTATELLTDDFFLESEHTPTPESKLFWSKLEIEHEALAQEIAHARLVLGSVAHNHGRRLEENEVSKLWDSIKTFTTNKTEKKHYHLLYRWLAATACVATLFLGSWFTFLNTTESNCTQITSIKRPNLESSDEIQLILSDSKKLTINGEENKLLYKERKIAVNSETIQLNENEVGAEAYNQLIVPAGKRSSIVFSDGTQLFVNANTRVVYPVKFADNKREIYVEGEVFLEVFPDKSRPFVVKTTRMDVRVLGTKFNVNAYTDNQSVVLVSGMVEVDVPKIPARKIKLNEMLTYHENEFQVRTVDVSNYISWVQGYCTFEKERLSTVVNTLSQYFNKEIIISKRLENVTCSGKLNLQQSLEEVLETLVQTISAKLEKNEADIYRIQ